MVSTQSGQSSRGMTFNQPLNDGSGIGPPIDVITQGDDVILWLEVCKSFEGGKCMIATVDIAYCKSPHR